MMRNKTYLFYLNLHTAFIPRYFTSGNPFSFSLVPSDSIYSMLRSKRAGVEERDERSRKTSLDLETRHFFCTKPHYSLFISTNLFRNQFFG